MELRYEGIRFEDWPSNIDGQTFLITPNGVKWFGGLTVRREEVGRSNAAGAFDLPGFMPQRVIPVSGELLASSPEYLERMKLQLLGIGDDGVSHRGVYTDAGVTTWRDMSVAVQASFGPGDETSCPFEMSFWAADPFAYGETRTFASSEQAYHYGSTVSWPTVTVTGAGSGYTVSSQGRSFQVTTALPSGQKDVIDMATGRVMRQGSLLVGGVGSARVWSIPKGAPTTWSVTGATATLAVTDTFI